jgi:glyoxylase-like metal-dependent hydrolase (beta-lactamase superfamily II)
VEHDHGLALIDTGIGRADRAAPLLRLGVLWTMTSGMDLAPELSAFNQIEAMGLDPYHVTDIVLTHMDLDHAGGVDDFPDAVVHVSKTEFEAAVNRSAVIGMQRGRYRPIQWKDHEHWELYERGSVQWMGIEGCSPIRGLPDLMLVPLPGHSLGHSGVAIKRDDGGWILHVGDAYVTRFAIWNEPPAPTIFDRWFDRTIAVDLSAYDQTQAALARIARDHADEVEMICSHDPRDLARSLEQASSK